MSDLFIWAIVFTRNRHTVSTIIIALCHFHKITLKVFLMLHMCKYENNWITTKCAMIIYTLFTQLFEKEEKRKERAIFPEKNL